MNVDYSCWEGYELAGSVETVLARGTVIVDRRRVPRVEG